jgi:hypothetical protein
MIQVIEGDWKVITLSKWLYLQKMNAILLQFFHHFKARTLLCSSVLKTQAQPCWLKNAGKPGEVSRIFYSGSSVLESYQWASYFPKPRKTKVHGVKSGLDGGHFVGARRPVHPTGK